MKKISLIVICFIALVACNKTPSNNTTVTTISANHIDTVTLIDDGITYVDTETNTNGAGARIILNKTNAATFFSMTAYANTHFPLAVTLQDVPGPINGIGVYKMSPVDSFSNQDNFVETYSGGDAYNVDSITVTITSAAATLVSGSYQVWLRNIAGSKTVTGTINCHHAEIE